MQVPGVKFPILREPSTTTEHIPPFKHRKICGTCSCCSLSLGLMPPSLHAIRTSLSDLEMWPGTTRQRNKWPQHGALVKEMPRFSQPLGVGSSNITFQHHIISHRYNQQLQYCRADRREAQSPCRCSPRVGPPRQRNIQKYHCICNAPSRLRWGTSGRTGFSPPLILLRQPYLVGLARQSGPTFYFQCWNTKHTHAHGKMYDICSFSCTSLASHYIRELQRR